MFERIKLQVQFVLLSCALGRTVKEIQKEVWAIRALEKGTVEAKRKLFGATTTLRWALTEDEFEQQETMRASAIRVAARALALVVLIDKDFLENNEWTKWQPSKSTSEMMDR